MEKTMRLGYLSLLLVLAGALLVGCGGQSSSGAEAQNSAAQAAGSAADAGYTSAVLTAAHERALPASSQLAVGTFLLEGTPDAVTPDQARTLLPLWKAVKAGVPQNDDETVAVLKQIERIMTPQQLAAIAAMQLTTDDLGDWMQKQGMRMGPPPGAAGGPGLPEGMTEEELAAARAARQTGGGSPGQGGPRQGGFAPPEGMSPPEGMAPPQNMSAEERASLHATAEAGGMTFGRGPAATGQIVALAEPLVKLLAERAAR
jgi:hypothetical protein